MRTVPTYGTSIRHNGGVLPAAWADRADLIEMMAHAVYANRWVSLDTDQRDAVRYDMVYALVEAERHIYAELRAEIAELDVSRGSIDNREFISLAAMVALLDAKKR